MKRWILRVAAGLSAALGVAVLAAWPWSYLEPVTFSTLPLTALASADLGVVACEGRAMLYVGRSRPPVRTFTGVFYNGQVLFNLDLYRAPDPAVKAVEADWQAGPFAYYRAVEMGTRYRRLFVPLWFPLLALSLLPALWLRRLRQSRWARRRLTAGECPGCGYDLCGGAGRLDVRSARCPECGRSPLEAYDAAL